MVGADEEALEEEDDCRQEVTHEASSGGGAVALEGTVHSRGKETKQISY